MISIVDAAYNDIGIDTDWNLCHNPEPLMHTIHAYPAKFPSFIASKAFAYAENEGVVVNKVADIFCGCGTVALEARLHEKPFWGCDINPVATLIAKTKSKSYKSTKVAEYYSKIKNAFNYISIPDNSYRVANERLRYWFTEKNYIDLYKLLQCICTQIPSTSKYKGAFLCIFSAILKSTSRWLTKSIKPQIDPKKKEVDVFKAFSAQYNKFYEATRELEQTTLNNNKIEIVTSDFIKIVNLPKVDLIISSPPYVTSYEYADLHQLSSLWLGYAEDYRTLRCGSIGSTYYNKTPIDYDLLNDVGKNIVSNMVEAMGETSKTRSVAKYYIDMQHAIKKCHDMLTSGGMVFWVVGDTEYKGVQIQNSRHLVRTLLDEGFSDIKLTKRRISKKMLTPYRDSIGRFSSDKTQRVIYHDEFIISGRLY